MNTLPTINFSTCTEAELNAAVAVSLGREVNEHSEMRLPNVFCGDIEMESWAAIPPYATSADALAIARTKL